MHDVARLLLHVLVGPVRKHPVLIRQVAVVRLLQERVRLVDEQVVAEVALAITTE